MLIAFFHAACRYDAIIIAAAFSLIYAFVSTLPFFRRFFFFRYATPSYSAPAAATPAFSPLMPYFAAMPLRC